MSAEPPQNKLRQTLLAFNFNRQTPQIVAGTATIRQEFLVEHLSNSSLQMCN